MSRVALLLAAAMVALALSGCNEPAKPDPGSTTTGPPVVTERYGAITGLLLNDLYRPINGGSVLLQEKGLVATTDDRGVFNFGELEKGRYTLRANADGHAPVTRFVEVVPNEYTEVEVIEDRLVNQGSRIVTNQYSIFTPCAESAVATAVVHGYCFYDASGDSYRPGLSELNYTGYTNVTYLVAEVVVNQPDNYDWVIRHDDGSSFGAEEFGSARMTKESPKGRVILQFGANYLNATQPGNAVWKNDVPLGALLFYLGDGGDELAGAGCAPGADAPTCRDYYGVGNKMAIEGDIVLSLFLGEPDKPIEEYCTITC